MNMKKILIILLIIWLVYLVYLNFFYKGSRILCTIGLPAAVVITITFFLGILWIGLPFSYILKYLFSKLFKFSVTTNKFLQTFSIVAKPIIFFFLFPFIFSMLIFFKVFESSNDIIFSIDYLFFVVQFSGLIYIYLIFSGKFNKYFLK